MRENFLSVPESSFFGPDFLDTFWDDFLDMFGTRLDGFWRLFGHLLEDAWGDLDCSSYRFGVLLEGCLEDC